LVDAYGWLNACAATRLIRRETKPVVIDEALGAIISKCQTEICSRQVEILCSEVLPVPVTLGLLRPIIILPQHLVRDADVELLTSAIGHEFIHVARRDYVLNLVYEFFYVTVSFNPFSSLIRRRIKQTRELSCDE